MRTVHAEINAIAQAAYHGTQLKDATAYVTLEPCWNCYKTLVNAGITEIVFEKSYAGRIRDFEGGLGIREVSVPEGDDVQERF